MAERSGPFWDAMAGRVSLPPAAVTLGFELLRVDPDAGELEAAFTATEAFLNPAGAVQGGFLAAMLDDTMGPALVATLASDEWAPTLELKISFLRSAYPGRLVGCGRVVHRAGGVAFLAGELRDETGMLLATATATARIGSSGRSVRGDPS